jgi:hypothetical protein
MDNALRELLVTATAKTEAGRLKWKAFDSESFRAAIGSGYLHIQRGSTRIDDDEGESMPAVTYSAQVSDEQGRVVAEADVTEGFQMAEFMILATLFATARKSALQTDRVIEDMLEVLRRE